MLLMLLTLLLIGCNVKYKRNFKYWEYRMSKEEMKKTNQTKK
jgi:hypothetical protein